MISKLKIFPFLSLTILSALFTRGLVAEEPAEVTTEIAALLPDFPSMPLEALPGSYVLCPPIQQLQKAAEAGMDQSTFTYYAATMVESGKASSVVKTLAGTVSTIPNKWIITIPEGQKAKVGDILLSWWQSGSGMQRAIVTGGTANKPIVRYLDLDYDNPSGIGKQDDTLKPDTFYVLSEAGQVGTTAVVRIKGEKQLGRIVGLSDQFALIYLWAGRVDLVKRDLVQPLPIKPEIKTGDEVMIAPYGSTTDGKVKEVDEKIGRVFVEFDWGGKPTVEAFAFGNLQAL